MRKFDILKKDVGNVCKNHVFFAAVCVRDDFMARDENLTTNLENFQII